jgi:uncharacterized OsmC-like protein
MGRAALRAGAIGGILGGVMMAVWLMFILWLVGTGFWTLLNLIANTFWRGSPLGDTFSWQAVIIGLVVHVLMSILFGSLIAIAAWWLPWPRSLIIAGGALFGPALWLVMQYGIWRAADPAAAQVITPWVFAVAHLIFGVLAAATAAIVVSDEKAAARRRRADPEPEGQEVQSAWAPARPEADSARAQTLASPMTFSSPMTLGGPTALDRPASLGGPASRGGPPPNPTMPGHGPVRHRRLLTARNDAGLRTVVYTSGGPGMVTDEPVRSGGSGTALTPLETVLGALCGSTGATLATVAREAGFGYDGATFEASFTLDPRGLAAQAGARTYFRTVRVEIQVRAAQPGPRLADVARATEQRCPVRNLLADAGVTVDMIWTVASPQAPAPEVPETPSVLRRPAN